MATRWVLTLVVVFVIILVVTYYPVSLPTTNFPISYWAHLDLSTYGHYDAKYSVSLKFLLTDIYVRLYLLYSVDFIKTHDALMEWNSHQPDPHSRTHLVITQVYSNLNSILKQAQEKNEEPDFRIDISGPIPAPSSVLRCNDYCDLQALIQTFTRLTSGG